jgi:hypothetical protein
LSFRAAATLSFRAATTLSFRAEGEESQPRHAEIPRFARDDRQCTVRAPAPGATRSNWRLPSGSPSRHCCPPALLRAVLCCHSEPCFFVIPSRRRGIPAAATPRSLASLGMTSEPPMTSEPRMTSEPGLMSEPGLISERGMAREPGMTGGAGLALAAAIRKRVPIRGASPSFRAETATVSSLPDQGRGSSECVWSGDISRWGSSKAPKLHADPPGPEGRKLAAHRMRAFGPSCGAVP